MRFNGYYYTYNISFQSHMHGKSFKNKNHYHFPSKGAATFAGFRTFEYIISFRLVTSALLHGQVIFSNKSH